MCVYNSYFSHTILTTTVSPAHTHPSISQLPFPEIYSSTSSAEKNSPAKDESQQDKTRNNKKGIIPHVEAGQDNPVREKQAVVTSVTETEVSHTGLELF